LFSSPLNFHVNLDIIGTISIGADMKTALQQEDESDNGPTDAKGKKILSPEEKKKKEEEERRQSEHRAKVREKRGMTCFSVRVR
jgi:hypothetical protein